MATELELRQRVVGVMKSWLGYSEANGKFREIIDLYNTQKPLPAGYKMKYTDEWCAATVTAAGIEAGLSDIILGECSCSRMIALYQKRGLWVENDAYRPDIGDIIMYDWDDTGKGENTGAPEHVGIVGALNGNTMTIYEGNKGEAVATRTLQVNGRYIRGYCTPDYKSKATESEDEDDMTYYKTINDVPADYKASIQKLITKGVLKGYGNGQIDVSEDFCRTMTVLDRLGKL